jgi:hypothetical protein
MDTTMIVQLMRSDTLVNVNQVLELGGYILKGGKIVSDVVRSLLERAEQKNKESGGKAEDMKIEISDEERKALKKECMTLIERYAHPVYMAGVALFCNPVLSDEEQEMVKSMLIHINDDEEDWNWNTQEANDYQAIVDEFMCKHMGDDNVSLAESDCEVYDDTIYINFGFYDDDDYYRLYNEEEIKKLADAINHILQSKSIINFAVY